MNNRALLFLETLDNKFRMITRDDLLRKVEENKDYKPIILDFRGEKSFNKSRIKGSLNIELKNLPNFINNWNKEEEIVTVCNGSIQSGYAIYFLYMIGFENVSNLAGGYSGCEKNNFSLIEKFN